jgi:hypothetical protein
MAHPRALSIGNYEYPVRFVASGYLLKTYCLIDVPMRGKAQNSKEMAYLADGSDAQGHYARESPPGGVTHLRRAPQVYHRRFCEPARFAPLGFSGSLKPIRYLGEII